MPSNVVATVSEFFHFMAVTRNRTRLHKNTKRPQQTCDLINDFEYDSQQLQRISSASLNRWSRDNKNESKLVKTKLKIKEFGVLLWLNAIHFHIKTTQIYFFVKHKAIKFICYIGLAHLFAQVMKHGNILQNEQYPLRASCMSGRHHQKLSALAKTHHLIFHFAFI